MQLPRKRSGHDVAWFYEIRNKKAHLVATHDGYASREAAKLAGDAMAATFKEVGAMLGSAVTSALIVTTGKTLATAR
jgi:hypothetical protein